MHFNFLAATLLSGVLASVASAHPGHGEPGWIHQHSATMIVATVVGVIVLAMFMHAALSATTETIHTASRRIDSNGI